MEHQPHLIEHRSALDVAEYILGHCGPLEPKKLQKLVYYSQAWSLAWNDHALFNEKIEAWVHGPVVSELYQMHEHQKEVLAVGGHAERLTSQAKKVIDEVLLYYGNFTGDELSALSHRESPWLRARGELAANLPSSEEVTRDSMREFYRNRPCGGGEPVTDVSSLSAERVMLAREQLRLGRTISLEDL